ncbi:MAG: hypothetical protein ACLVJX_06500 [Merdibacter sp.]
MFFYPHLQNQRHLFPKGRKKKEPQVLGFFSAIFQLDHLAMSALVSLQPFAGRLFILQSYNDSVWTRGEYPLNICGRASYQSNFTSQFNSVNAFPSMLHTITPQFYFIPKNAFLQSDSTAFFRIVRHVSTRTFSAFVIL